MKSLALHKIYAVFADWSKNLPTVCNRGCSACCTRNVTITAGEGEDILRYVIAENLSPWMAEKLAHTPTHRPATMTNNDFAAACLEGRDTDPRATTTKIPPPAPFWKISVVVSIPSGPSPADFLPRHKNVR